MKKKALVLYTTLCLLSGGYHAYAIEDTVVISQNILGNDVMPPSIPGNVVAVAVSTSQINVTWDPSTDNAAVDGYQVFRDGFQIATTALTTYADTGLVAATTYGYTVRAFDAVGNISSSSATSSTTTDATPVPSTVTSTSEGGSEGSASFAMHDLLIRPSQFSADISWTTTLPTQSVVSWGRTEDYEIASLEERSLLEAHATRLTGLLPGTQYFFRITSRDRYGRERLLVERSFVTTSLPDTEAPVNVRNLVGLPVGDDVLLSWQNPTSEDLGYVRIVRRMDGFPVDPNDGIIVYEGRGGAFRDKGIFFSNDRAHYAVFAYDRSGNPSSGALVRVEKIGSIPEPEDQAPSDVAVIAFWDLIFVQGGQEISYIGEEVHVDGTQPLLIKIPYDRLPEHLKTIVVTLSLPQDRGRTFSFLLRVNTDKSAYTAALAPFDGSGDYPVSLSILDYHQKTVTEIMGTLIVEDDSGLGLAEQNQINKALKNISRMDPLFWILFLFLALILPLLLSRIRQGRRDT